MYGGVHSASKGAPCGVFTLPLREHRVGCLLCLPVYGSVHSLPLWELLAVRSLRPKEHCVWGWGGGVVHSLPLREFLAVPLSNWEMLIMSLCLYC